MTPKEALKAIKISIAEHLHKQTGLSVDKHFEYLQYDTEIEIVEQALTELDRLQKFKATFDAYELSKKQDFIAYENWQECEKELEELKRDVKRYFELRAILRWAPEELSVDKIKEFDTLNDKLWEVALKDKKVGNQ